MLRLFVACVPSAATRAGLARETEHLLRAAPSLRGVDEDDLHLTLAFLGATPEARVAPLSAALAAVAAAQAPFEVRVEGLGAFPSFQRPSVLWAGLEAGPGASALVGLAKRVRRACSAAGCPPDATGTFEPHVTLARFGGRGRGGAPNPPAALEMLLTGGALQGTYTPELLSDLVLMVSEATSLLPLSDSLFASKLADLGPGDPAASASAPGAAAPVGPRSPAISPPPIAIPAMPVGTAPLETPPTEISPSGATPRRGSARTRYRILERFPFAGLAGPGSGPSSGTGS